MDDQRAELEEAIEEKKRIYAALKKARQIIRESPDANERSKQREQARILDGMYQDAKERVERLTPPEQRSTKVKAPKQRKVSAANFSEHVMAAFASENGQNPFLSWEDIEGTKWVDMEGDSWEELGDAVRTAAQAMSLQAIIKGAYEALTERQVTFIDLRSQRMALQAIADSVGVNKSTVWSTIKRGMARMEKYIWARCYIPDCIVDGKRFDYIKFAKGSSLLTGRQLEVIFGHMHDGVTLQVVATNQGVNKSTVWRTEQCGIKNFAFGGVTFDESIATGTLTTEEYSQVSKQEICEYLGVSPSTYYRIVCRNRPVGEVSRYHYEIMRRIRDGKTVKEVCQEIGCTDHGVRAAIRWWGGKPLPEPSEPLEEYNPKVWNGSAKSQAITKAFMNQRKYGIIADNISAPIYVKLIKGGGDNAAGT